ncbi:hypothetical protein [Bacillus pinisoli]|uniref:hypothetical protein n=1 Tax=Bacillus pinisoli TaxID=2901866 RepID=UPI001FF56912|nr:hypothetical protein [Bacillus pinisoli]
MSKGSLRGFSIGILLATALLTITLYTSENTTIENTAQPLTDEDVKRYLSEANQTAITNEEHSRLKELETENQQLKKQLAQATTQKEAVEESKEKDENKSEPEIKYIFEIKQGMTTPEISKKLEDLNIIKNSTDLSNYLKDKGWEGSIQIGTFELSSTMSVEEIAKIITKNP